MVRWALLVVLAAVIMSRYTWIVKKAPRYASGMSVKIEGVINDDPRRMNNKQIMDLYGITVELVGTEPVYYGERVRVVGKLEERVIEGRPVGFKLVTKRMEKLGSERGWMWGFRSWGRKLINNLQIWLPGDEGALAGGILIGGSAGLSRGMKEAFARAGVMHVVAASGYNVSVVAGWSMVLAGSMVGRKWGRWLAMAAIGGYVLLAGATASVVRAGIMAAGALVGAAWGRETDAKWWLVVTAGVMLLVNPMYLTDVGWQLSFAATFGILMFLNTSPPGPLSLIKERGTEGVRWWGWLVADLKTTLAATVTTLPILLYHFGNLSVISPVVNAVVLWVVPIIMQVAGLAAVVGLGWPMGGQMIAYLAWPGLRWMTWVVENTAGWSISSWEVGRISGWWVAGYYAVLVVCLKLYSWRR